MFSCTIITINRRDADLSDLSNYWRPLGVLASNSHEIDLSCQASGNHALMAMRFHDGGEHVTPCPRSESFSSQDTRADSAVGEYTWRSL